MSSVRPRETSATHVLVTGASGKLGPRVVEELLAQGASVKVIGRDASRLEGQFDTCEVGGWERLEVEARSSSAIIHLAVRNNDSAGSEGQFHADNVLLTERVAHACAATGARLVFPSTFRAFDPPNADLYGRTKREAESIAKANAGPNLAILRLPAVVDGDFAGRLSPLNALPNALRPVTIIGSLRPEVTADEACSALVSAALAPVLPAPDFEDVSLVFSDKDDNAWYRVGKRGIDLLSAVGIIVFLWWLLFVVWVVVRLGSRGPGLFIQRRVGRAGHTFRCYKFRTMAEGTPQDATHLVSQSSVTSIGRFLRRSKLDELPQVVNLLNGTMSLVGPRPCLPTQTELIAARRALGVDTLVPGITGYAQIRDIDMSNPKRLARADYAYKARRSLILDARIVLATISGKGLADRTAAS